MSNKRLWIALAAIPISLASLLILGAQRSHPASAGGVIDPTCTSPSPCIQYMNNSSGPGIEGLSLLGNGLFGVTKFKSTSASNGKAGIFGNDQSTSGTFDVGVRGLSVRGIGVAGQSTSGAGISATSSSGDAIDAASSSGEGLHATSKSSPAVDGTSQSSDGVIGSGPNAGVQGVGPNVGVLGRSFNLGVAVESDNRDGVGVLASGGGSDTSGALYPALAVNGNNFNPDLIYTCSYGMLSPCRTGGGLPAPLFAAVNNGNVFITGTIHTAGSCSSGCAPTATIGERRVRLFTPQESLPTIEDFGQGQLVAGQTYVRIDPAFANTVDKREPYLVFITPEGDSNGLYVINKSLAGFEVHENRGGRSTLAFSYRIVARPFGQHPARLKMITATRPGISLPESRMQ